MKKFDERVRFVFDADPDLVLAIDGVRTRYGQSRKAFVNEVLRSVFKLPNQVQAWVAKQEGPKA